MHASAGKHKRDNALEARLIPGRISCCPMTCVKIIEAVHHFHKPFGASQAMLQFITRSHPLKYTAQCRRNLNDGCFSLTPPHAVKLGCFWTCGGVEANCNQGLCSRASLHVSPERSTRPGSHLILLRLATASGTPPTCWAPTQTTSPRGPASWTPAGQVRAAPPAQQRCITSLGAVYCLLARWQCSDSSSGLVLSSAAPQCCRVVHCCTLTNACHLQCCMPVLVSCRSTLHRTVPCCEAQDCMLAHRWRHASHIPGLRNKLHAAPVPAI